MIAQLSTEDYGIFLFSLILVLGGLLAVFLFGWLKNRRSECPSPYTGRSLRKASQLSWISMEKVLRFLYLLHDPDNPLPDFYRAAWCRETGRIFSRSVSWFDTIHVDWNFLNKRYSGNWVSWGSLTEEQKVMIEARHDSLKGFQTEFSSERPLPHEVEKKYAFAKPGPLYVDIDTGVLLGWMVVPDTDLEVLIVQKPKRRLK